MYVLNGICLLLIFLYTLHQYILSFYYFKSKNPEILIEFTSTELPFITVQLPIYNEKYVLESLFKSISELDYPKHLLEIQVLDDSTDESRELVIQKTKELEQAGFECSYIHRKNRQNFKAGALANGLELAKGELFAIFDADFIPASDWLNKVVHYFTIPEIGFVQTRWAYVNREKSLLTRVQAMALDYHFTIEQVGRSEAGFAFNFNGTAGIWRKSCILNAGNWQGDTLTEDLDLSLRAHLSGWQSFFLEELATYSELPETMAAVRSQQFRWNKGGAQNLVKFWSKIWTSDLSFFQKINTVLHLLNSSIFLFVLLFAVSSLFILYYGYEHRELEYLLWPGIFLKYNFIFIFLAFYYVHRKCNPEKGFISFVITYLVFFPYVLAISWHNSLAVLEAYFKKKSDFIRTPKFSSATLKTNIYHFKVLNWKVLAEFGLLVYFALGIVFSFIKADFSYLAVYISLCVGYCFILFKSINE
jgi:cellulose synthase/poly-beta-1,6-N-acetylglucosamine synthase-like glycosyltransferase